MACTLQRIESRKICLISWRSTSSGKHCASGLPRPGAEAVAKHTCSHRMDTVLKTVQAALSKSAVSVGWMERSATHQEQADAAAPDGGLHAMALTLFFRFLQLAW